MLLGMFHDSAGKAKKARDFKLVSCPMFFQAFHTIKMALFFITNDIIMAHNYELPSPTRGVHYFLFWSMGISATEKEMTL